MGMFDAINGQQIKCFPWVSLLTHESRFTSGPFWYHYGKMKNFCTGDEVPYKRPHYNYGKNFIVIDGSPYYPEDDYNYIIHVIVDGKVKDTFINEIGDIDWTINQSVVEYCGRLLNVHSAEDILQYIDDDRIYWKEKFKLKKTLADILRKVYNPVYIAHMQKYNEFKTLSDAEAARISADLDALEQKYKKWYVDTTPMNDLIRLGEYITAASINSSRSEEDKEICYKEIKKLLSADPTLYDRYVEWQGSDEFLLDFKDFKEEEKSFDMTIE